MHVGRRALLLALLTVGMAGGLAEGAHADDPSTGNSAVSQYVEAIPTSGGAQAVGTGKNVTTAKLSKQAVTGLGSVSAGTAAQLSAIATSSAYGAPKAAVVPPVKHTPSASTSAAPTSIPTIAADPATASGDTRLIGLGGVLALLSGLLITASILRGRSPRG